MAEIHVMPTREQQLAGLAGALRGVITVVPGVYWTVPCPADGGVGRSAVQWTDAKRGALVVKCQCGTPSEILAEALGLPGQALSSPRSGTFDPIEVFMASTGQKPRWLLEPFVPVGSLVLVQGAPKSGKTFFAAWLACELARIGITTLFVEEEGSVDMQGDRFRPFLLDGTGVDLEGRLMIAFRKRFRLDVSGRVDGLIGWIKDTKAQVVVLDPFKLLHQSDEQSASELTPVLDALQRVITETGCTIILLHHTKKGASYDKSDNSDAQSSDARGSSAIIGSVDHIMAVKGVPPAQRTPGEVRFILECADSRVAQPFDKRQGVVRLSGGADALTWTETKASEDKTAALLERVLPIVPFEPRLLARTSIRKALNCNKTELDRAVRLGLQTGVLREISHKGLYRPGTGPELDHD